MRTLCRGLIAPALIIALATSVLANDSERDRKARAALALAGAAKPATVTAPAPRLAVVRDYGAGCKAAAEQEKPLVVYVGCPGQNDVPGAVTAKADQLADVKGPAVVVGFPAGERMYIHATLECPVTDAKLAASVKAAAKKVGDPAPREMPAPKALDWDVRGEPAKGDLAVGTCVMFGEGLAKQLGLTGCSCGDVCPCKVSKVRDVRDSLVRVRKGNAQGSGTVVHSGGGWSLVLTAAHVVDGQGPLTVRCAGKTVAAQVIEADSAADLAAILIPGDFPAVAVRDGDVSDGAEVLMYGMTSIYTRGTVTGRETLNGSENLAYATAADSDSGDSGAGVFCEGKLCGVHLGKMGTQTADKPRAAATGPVRRFLARVLKADGSGLKATAPKELPKSDPAGKSVSGPGPAIPAGAIRASSGRVLLPNGNGTYRYADDAPGGCPNGRCPLPR